ncbi:hypothetical protein [Guptibacillus hwajinpoensis]|uniref:Uncharacterized protein n=2 Tax=Guptibacillus hwajinpoensis TaxID=208199 RepID=A0A0J6CR82_9BACL|nr:MULTISPECIES: hypothetical protein [Alkalihalobacillus]KMM38816.1 hypothetical protein AB986_06015 [Alkalihalobacillus macyae]MDP4553159.1 hypothetical protein [Alkalihalobacillus macyae]MDQ0482733.1 hypothetical protein [Alkalihalobacillus hemicentroti]
MKQVIQSLQRNEAEKRIPVLRMEIDYELATLHDAMTASDKDEMKRCKGKLELLRQEMIRLEA